MKYYVELLKKGVEVKVVTGTYKECEQAALDWVKKNNGETYVDEQYIYDLEHRYMYKVGNWRVIEPDAKKRQELIEHPLPYAIHSVYEAGKPKEVADIDERMPPKYVVTPADGGWYNGHKYFGFDTKQEALDFMANNSKYIDSDNFQVTEMFWELEENA